MFGIRAANGKIKYAGRSRAIVKDNRDPLQKGRIQVDHPILGHTVWIDYLRGPGNFDVPSIGDVVYIEAESGEYEHPVAAGAVTTGPDASPELPAQFRRDTPTNRGFFTPGGHLIEMDDGKNIITQELRDDQYTTEGRGIRITTKGGNSIHINEDTEHGNQSILIQDAGGNFMKLDYKDNKVTIRSSGKIVTNATTDQEETIGGNLQTNVDGQMSTQVTSNAVIQAGGNAAISGIGGTQVGDAGSVTEVNGQIVTMAGGGSGVARFGDRAFGIGNLGAPVSSVIISSSSKVFSS